MSELHARLTPRQVGELLHMTPGTVQAHALAGDFEDVEIDGITVKGAAKVGQRWLILPQSVEAFLARHDPVRRQEALEDEPYTGRIADYISPAARKRMENRKARAAG